MTDIGRFGVFLPSYIWAGDGPGRARGIKEFARAVEELGFDSLFVTDHLIAAKQGSPMVVGLADGSIETRRF